MIAELRAEGERVLVRTIGEADVAPYRVAVERSRARIGRWNPVNPDDLLPHLAVQSRSHRTFLVRARHPEGDHDVVGKVNVTNVVHGRFMSGAMGYDAYDPYAGRGLFSEGMRLVLGLAFAAEPGGMGLHRVEANVQPGNVTSAGLLRALGFRHEGFTPRMMWMADGAGEERWRDHDRYALTAEEWPSTPYAEQEPPRLDCLVHGARGPARTELARRLARELALPLYSTDVVGEVSTIARLLADSPVGGVLETELGSAGATGLREALAGAGIGPRSVAEIRCDAGTPADSATPGAVDRVLTVDVSGSVQGRDVSRLALSVRRLSASARQASPR